MQFDEDFFADFQDNNLSPLLKYGEQEYPNLGLDRDESIVEPIPFKNVNSDQLSIKADLPTETFTEELMNIRND